MHKASSNLIRKGRYSEKNRIYHVTSVTEGRAPVFTEMLNARILIRAMQREQQAEHLNSLAFVVMPDHLHWLLQIVGDQALSTCVGRAKSVSGREINQSLGRDGRLWQDGFHDHAVRKDEDIVHIARYIVANPVRAGLVKSIGRYPHWDAIWL